MKEKVITRTVQAMRLILGVVLMWFIAGSGSNVLADGAPVKYLTYLGNDTVIIISENYDLTKNDGIVTCAGYDTNNTKQNAPCDALTGNDKPTGGKGVGAVKRKGPAKIGILTYQKGAVQNFYLKNLHTIKKESSQNAKPSEGLRVITKAGDYRVYSYEEQANKEAYTVVCAKKEKGEWKKDKCGKMSSETANVELYIASEGELKVKAY